MKTIEKINKIKLRFSEKMKKTDKPRVIKEKRRLKITKIRNERGDITTKLTKSKRVIRNTMENSMTTI